MAARPLETSTSTPNNAPLNIVTTSNSISNNDNNNKPSPAPSKSTTRPPVRLSLPTPPSKIASVSSVTNKIRQASLSVTRRAGDDDSARDHQRRRQSTVGGFPSVREDDSHRISAAAAPNSKATTAVNQATKTRQSRLSSTLRRSAIPDRGLPPAAKKRLSFPPKASNNMIRSSPPTADKLKKEGKLRNGGEAGNGGGKELL
ncbi:uncharacterized protein LOC120192680 [Hibiscus syriacus]|uniref:uncharacterized protein LOC120192680 n=1 Tax=Hibiscus syriacus TaxID=106335 RepID=UPI0019247CDC|nr:uncharacterized protein LOC120192680 [Hibiscus syriacus]